MKNSTILAMIAPMIFTACFDEEVPVKSETPVPAVVEVETPTIDSAALLDSLMKLQVKLPVLIEPARFSQTAAKDFSKLASKTKGGYQIVRHVNEVSLTIKNVISRNVKTGTDILFLVDKTGSMSDDIEEIKTGMKMILKSLRKKKDIRFGMAFYGDRTSDSKWFFSSDFTTDYNLVESRIQDITAGGGGDEPESVYDGFFEATKRMDWDESRQKMVIILGDAPSQVREKSNYMLEDVVEFANTHGITTNFFPILLATNDDTRTRLTTPIMENFVSAMYPNPTNGPVQFRCNRVASYEYAVFDNSGKQVSHQFFTGMSGNIDLSAFENGLYVIRFVNQETSAVDIERVVLMK
jgi:Mg-chelatase subunit ChlD